MDKQIFVVNGDDNATRMHELLSAMGASVLRFPLGDKPSIIQEQAEMLQHDDEHDAIIVVL